MKKFLFLFLLLFSIYFSEEIIIFAKPIQKLIIYNYSSNFENVVPGITYNKFIEVFWAIPNQSLEGVVENKIVVLVKATTDNSSEVFFLNGSKKTKHYETYLICNITNSSCAEDSILHSKIPFVFKITNQTLENETGNSLNISIVAEIVSSEDQKEQNINFNIFDFFKNLNLFEEQKSQPAQVQNSEQPTTSQSEINQTQTGSGQAQNTENLQKENSPYSEKNIFEELKPETKEKEKNLFEFFKSNLVISLIAITIVIIITGSYVLRSKE
jgi:hypothetical protein